MTEIIEDDISVQIFKPDKVDIPDRLVDFGNDDQVLTANERLAKLKKKEEVRKMLSKQRCVGKNNIRLILFCKKNKIQFSVFKK